MCQANIWAPAHLVQQQAHAVACYGALREDPSGPYGTLTKPYGSTWHPYPIPMHSTF